MDDLPDDWIRYKSIPVIAKHYGISQKSARRSRLNNPGLSELARRVLVNFILREENLPPLPSGMNGLGMLSRVPGKEREIGKKTKA